MTVALIEEARSASEPQLAALVAELQANEIEPLVVDLLRDPASADLPLVRMLARREVTARRDAGCGDALYGLCFLLYLIGDLADVLLIDEAKHTSFDAGCTIDHDFYQMRRGRAEVLTATAVLLADPTIGARHPKLLAMIGDAFDHPNYDSAEHFESALRAYFGLGA